MKKRISVLLVIFMMGALVLGVGARDIDFQDYNLINIYEKSAPAVLDGRMTEKDGYGDPLVTLTADQFKANWGIDTNPGYEDINNDTNVIPNQVDIYGFYHDEVFYYCLVVNDLVHHNNGHDNLYSGGDSVFFNIVGDMNAVDDSSRYRYCLRITNDGVVDIYNYSENVSNEIDGYESWMVTRDEAAKITTYEIAVPLVDVLEDVNIDVGDFFYFQEGLEISKNDDTANDNCMTTLPGKETTRNFWKMTFAGAAPVIEETVAETEAEIAEAGDAVVTAPATADGITILAALIVVSLGGTVALKKRA